MDIHTYHPEINYLEELKHKLPSAHSWKKYTQFENSDDFLETYYRIDNDKDIRIVRPYTISPVTNKRVYWEGDPSLIGQPKAKIFTWHVLRRVEDLQNFKSALATPQKTYQYMLTLNMPPDYPLKDLIHLTERFLETSNFITSAKGAYEYHGKSSNHPHVHIICNTPLENISKFKNKFFITDKNTREQKVRLKALKKLKPNQITITLVNKASYVEGTKQDSKMDKVEQDFNLYSEYTPHPRFIYDGAFKAQEN